MTIGLRIRASPSLFFALAVFSCVYCACLALIEAKPNTSDFGELNIDVMIPFPIGPKPEKNRQEDDEPGKDKILSSGKLGAIVEGRHRKFQNKNPSSTALDPRGRWCSRYRYKCYDSGRIPGTSTITWGEYLYDRTKCEICAANPNDAICRERYSPKCCKRCFFHEHFMSTPATCHDLQLRFCVRVTSKLKELCTSGRGCGRSTTKMGCMKYIQRNCAASCGLCQGCPAKTFMCSDGKLCLPEDLKCDGENHCDDGSDEINCSCIGRCGSSSAVCSCTDTCLVYGNCCLDYMDVCGTDCTTALQGNQKCDDVNNNESCNFDGGDCCNTNGITDPAFDDCEACACLDPSFSADGCHNDEPDDECDDLAAAGLCSQYKIDGENFGEEFCRRSCNTCNRAGRRDLVDYKINATKKETSNSKMTVAGGRSEKEFEDWFPKRWCRRNRFRCYGTKLIGQKQIQWGDYLFNEATCEACETNPNSPVCKTINHPKCCNTCDWHPHESDDECHDHLKRRFCGRITTKFLAACSDGAGCRQGCKEACAKYIKRNCAKSCSCCGH